MSIISCNINLFDMEQMVYLDDKIIGRAPLESIDHLIVTLCNNHNVNDVYLKGVEAYTTPLKHRIEQEGVARYKNRINVKIVR